VAALDDSMQRVQRELATLRRYLAFDEDTPMEDIFKMILQFVEVRGL
jgi:hypothetical protein